MPARIAADLKNKFRFAFADISVVTSFINGAQPAYATIDIVEAGEASTRMAFLKTPTEHFDDPDELISKMTEYMNLGFELMRKGELAGPTASCPAFHCIFADSPKLQPYDPIFVDGVAKNRAALEHIFLHSADAQARANAVFLLAYAKDGRRLVRTLSKRIADENSLVRNNILRVFWYVSTYHHELMLPVRDVITALNYPAETDRNKASAVIGSIAADPTTLTKYRSEIVRDAVPILLKMLRLQQPNNHNPAYQILGAISGQNYGERDYDAWDHWFNK